MSSQAVSAQVRVIEVAGWSPLGAALGHGPRVPMPQQDQRPAHRHAKPDVEADGEQTKPRRYGPLRPECAEQHRREAVADNHRSQLDQLYPEPRRARSTLAHGKALDIGFGTSPGGCFIHWTRLSTGSSTQNHHAQPALDRPGDCNDQTHTIGPGSCLRPSPLARAEQRPMFPKRPPGQAGRRPPDRWTTSWRRAGYDGGPRQARPTR